MQKEGKETKPQEYVAHDWSHCILGPGSVALGQIALSPQPPIPLLRGGKPGPS